MSNSLYNLTNQFLDALDQISWHYDENEIDQQVINDTMEAMQAPIEEKVENIVKYMKSLEALADAKKLEAKRLSDSASSDLKKVEWFKNYMADNLKKVGIKDIQAGVFKVAFKKGSEVVKIDESKVPKWQEPFGNDIYDVIPESYKLKGKPELKKLIKDGQEIPGVSLVRNEDSLTIK
jgi:hypothetical protein